MKMYYVNILKCSDNNSYYNGFTNNIEIRLNEHEKGHNKNCYTYSKRPLSLVQFENFNNLIDAIAVDKKIKGWSSRKKNR